MNKNNKAVIYARVSSREQEETGYSLPEQQRFLKEYCERQSLSIAKVFAISESASGKNQRKIFNEMMSYLKKNKLNVIIVETTDRLTRNFSDVPEIDKWVMSNDKKQIHLVKEGCVLHKDSKSHEWFMWRVKVATAEYYIRLLSENVKKGQKGKIAEGWLPTKPPVGYKTIGEKGHKIHVIDEKTAPFISKMFELYATGNYSTRALMDEMYKLGLRNRSGNKIGKSRIYDLLIDPFYYGDLRWNNEVHEGKQVPIISKELFNLVQTKLNRKIHSPYYSKHLPTFKGKINCSDCKRTITWEKQRGHWYGGCKACEAKQGDTKYIREEKVEEQLLSKLKEVAPKNEKILNILERALKESNQRDSKNHQEQVKSIQTSVDRLQNRMDMMYDDKLDGVIKPDEYKRRFALYSSEQKDLLKQLEKLKSDKEEYYEAGFSIHELACRAREIYLSPKATTEDRRLLMSYTFSNLTLSKGELIVKHTLAFEFLQKWIPKVNEGFEHSNTVVTKGLNMSFSACSPTLLRRQDSNLQPIA